MVEPDGVIRIPRELFLQMFKMSLNNRDTGLADRVPDKKNFHGRKEKTPQQACDITYLNLSNRWASYPRFRGPRDPEG